MYHIKADKRSQASARLIVAGLYRCLEQKPFPRVTISDLQRASTVSRATFYRLFDNLADVLEYECDNVFRQTLAQAQKKTGVPSGPEETSPLETLVPLFAEYWMVHPALLNALLDSGRIDLMNAVYLSHTDEIRALLVPEVTLSGQELDYFVSVATSAIFGLFYAWNARGRKETSSELFHALRRSIHMVGATL